MSDEWTPPRCIHGRILLACPDPGCPTQIAYLDQQQAAIDEATSGPFTDPRSSR